MGAESSKTRHAILDAVEQLMLEQGYASVTYRGLAAKAGVAPALVQYYFPTLDDGISSPLERRVLAASAAVSADRHPQAAHN